VVTLYEEHDNLPLTREFRPKRVSDYIGNAAMVRSFYNSVRKKTLPQVVMIEGITGCGKTTFARMMTKEYLCEHVTEDGACGVCDTCRSIDEYIETGVAPSGIYEVDSSIDDNKKAIDNLLENALIPDFTKYKIYILDEFHIVKANAQTRFLKLIEEPPPHLIFIFCTTDRKLVLDTIQNRCQEIYTVTKPNIKELCKRLKDICDIKDIPYEKDGLFLIAKKSDQIIRDALNFLDKVVKEQGNVSEQAVKDCLEIISTSDFLKVVSYVRDKKIQPYIRWVSEINDHSLYMNSFLEYCKNGLYIVNNVGKNDLFTRDELKEYTTVFKGVSLQEFFTLFSNLVEMQRENVSDEIKLLMFGMKMMGIGVDTREEEIQTDKADKLAEDYIANQNYFKRHKKQESNLIDLSREAEPGDILEIFNGIEVNTDFKI